MPSIAAEVLAAHDYDISLLEAVLVESCRGTDETRMPTKPLDRLMFAQGGLCFFCAKQLPKSEASVEHLVASARGGSNSDDNCVACCKAVNALMGSMSLKEKIKVVLNQSGRFSCPNDSAVKRSPAPAVTKPNALPSAKPQLEPYSAVVETLRKQG